MKASIVKRIERLEEIFKPKQELTLDWGRLTEEERGLMKKASRIIMKHGVEEDEMMDLSVLSIEERKILDEAVIVLERHGRGRFE